MKSIAAILLIFPLMSAAQIIVPTTTKSFYATVEATWCGNCGQYGVPSNEDVIMTTAPRAVYAVLHRSASSDLYSSTAADIANEMGVAGQPIFTLNGEVVGPYSAGNIQDIKDSINSFYSSGNAGVNAGFNCVIQNDSIHAVTETTFFDDQMGDFYLGVYVLEDSIWNYQANYGSGGSGDIWHNKILRTSLNGSFGSLVASGTINNGSSYTHQFGIPIDPEWILNHLSVFTIIWRDNNGSYEFVNANDEGGVLENLNISKQESISFNLYPNPAKSEFTVASEVSGKLKIYNLSGALVKEIELKSSTQKITVQDDPGTYIIELSTEQGTVRKKLQIF